jgi:hypothetical protein
MALAGVNITVGGHSTGQLQEIEAVARLDEELTGDGLS